MATRKNSRRGKSASSSGSTESKNGYSERMKARWRSPAYRRKMSAMAREVWKSDERRAKHAAQNERVWTGRRHTEATKNKISESKRGKRLSKETRAKMSASHRGKPSPALGYRHTPETRARMSATRKGRRLSASQIKNLSMALTGRVVPLTARQNMSKAQMLRWQNAPDADYERIAKNGNRGKWTWYNGTHFRSTYEARFAEALDRLNWPWVYEPKRFRLATTSYLPDFFVPTMKCYVEIKGWFDENSKEKVKCFREEHPDLSLIVMNEKLLKQFERLQKTIKRH